MPLLSSPLGTPFRDARRQQPLNREHLSSHRPTLEGRREGEEEKKERCEEMMRQNRQGDGFEKMQAS